MSSYFDFKNRQIVPRWLPYKFACNIGGISKSNIEPSYLHEDLFEDRKKEWSETKGLSYAVDLLGIAFELDRYDNIVLEAANSVLKHKKSSNLSKELANKVLQHTPIDCENLIGNDERDLYKQIAILRLLLQDYPYNPIMWVDLAFYYCILGHTNKASKCIMIALSINKNNRFILRSSSRFFLHKGDPEKALYFLRHTESGKNDPWIVSAEISISEAFEEKPKRLNQGMNLIKSGNFNHKDLSELKGAIATLEANHGTIKKAKKLLIESLIDPNENTVAQAEWLVNQIGGEIRRTKEIPALFEADARKLFDEGNYYESLNSSNYWFNYQPYSSRPAIFGSYVASIGMMDNFKAIELIKKATLASQDIQHHFMLYNNLVFSLLSENKIQEAETYLSKFDPNILSPEHKATYYATNGLYNFRTNNPSKGREYYQKSVDIFQSSDSSTSLAIAYTFWGREENKYNIEKSSQLLYKAEALASKNKMHEILNYISKIKL